MMAEDLSTKGKVPASQYVILPVITGNPITLMREKKNCCYLPEKVGMHPVAAALHLTAPSGSILPQTE